MMTDNDVSGTMRNVPARRSPASPSPSDATSTAGTSGEEYLRIEQVAARTGLTKRTLRYYEEIGLLPAPSRTEGGYRLYSEREIQELERIKRLKDLLGFSLAEIREIAQAEEEREQVRAAWGDEPDPQARLEWLDRLDAQSQRLLRLVDAKQAGLEEMRDNLNARRERWSVLRRELNAQVAARSTRNANGEDS